MKESRKDPIWVRVINQISEISGYISGFCILIASLIVVQQVIVRLFGKSTIWQTEMTIYILMFTTFIGSAYALKHDAHVGVDVIIEKLSPKFKSILRIITSLMSLFVTVVVAYKGWGMWYEATTHGWHSETIWGPSLVIPYILLPIGMSLTSLQFLVVIYEDVRKLKTANAAKADEKINTNVQSINENM